MGAISLASVVVGFEIGANAKTSDSFVPHPTVTPTPTKTTPGPKPTTPTPNPTTPTPKPTTPKPTTPPPVTTVKHTSSPVYYRFGTVQLTVAKQGSTITDITLNQAGATNGRSAAFNYLTTLAMQAQSGSFDTSMMSGATYTTDAFMQALNDALSQF
jgi:uncharacterized protein with FMN-binding domain